MRILTIALLVTLTSLFDNCYARTSNQPHASDTLNFDTGIDPEIKFAYPDTIDNIFLRQLRTEYELLKVVEDCKSEIEKVKVLTHWTSIQWKHTSSNRPSKNDALTILKEAKQGKQFRCVEYSYVLCAALNAVGLKSRVLSLKTKDVETRKYGAGHVVVETYLTGLDKWIMADGQFNVIPTLDNLPLNAVEFQKAISKRDKLTLVDNNGTLKSKSSKKYLGFINEYLYYFDISFDNRIEPVNERLKVKEKAKLMLVPIGAKNPGLFEVSSKIDYCLYSNSLTDFYRKP
jgi:hypothetical protein